MKNATVGMRVFARSFKDCFGIERPAVNGLTVVAVKSIKGSCPFVRLTAVKDTGPTRFIEASERFFEREGQS